jgi:CO/xanthine dehydrogenase Mo-binding subunit
VREKALRIAAHLLEADPADLELRNGEARVVGSPERRVSLAELAAAADLPVPTADDLDRIAELREGGGLRVEPSATTNPGGGGR